MEICVIGLGIFGYEIAKKLTELGNNVLALDNKPSKINDIKDEVTEAIIGDATNPEVLKELNIKDFDVIILGMGSKLENLILCLTYLKKLGAKKIIAKANSLIQAEILEKIGADEIILPEKEIAEKLAHKLSNPNITELLSLDENLKLIEVKVPEKLTGKTLRELDLRKRFNITALMIKKNSKIRLITDPELKFEKGDEIIVAGNIENIQKAFN